MLVVQPFTIPVDAVTHMLKNPARRVIRRLSDMRGYYADAAAEAALVETSDPVLYEMYEPDVPEQPGHVKYCTTTMYPGRVGDEYFMTKGHVHEVRETAEVYFFLQGQGALICELPGGDVDVRFVSAGDVCYVPPGWAHRTVNTSDENLVFFAVYPAEAGHDYDFIQERGFAVRVVQGEDGKPRVIDARSAKAG